MSQIKRKHPDKKGIHLEKAVAIRYDEEKDDAPRLIAKGEGFIARKIKAIALEHGIEIKRDDDLVELLAQVDIDREIPEELYAAVAEILSWIYRANQEIKQERNT
jgi:flagellar biosynthesis protein